MSVAPRAAAVVAVLVLVLASLPVPVAGQELPPTGEAPQPPPAGEGPEPLQGQEPAEAPAAELRPFRLGGEAKVSFRSSRAVEALDPFPFPPSFIPPGDPAVFMRTTDPGESLELVNLALIGEGDLSSGVAAKVEVHFFDLYNRNPTSTDDKVFVREAWIRFGRSYENLERPPGTSAYVLAGQAPRFSKQRLRRLESYGLWGTAVGRFENPQVQAGGFLGKNVYWRLSGGVATPLFFRDPNALAADNGTFDRVPGDVRPVLQSGFPILYDSKPVTRDLKGRFELGAGLGLRWHGEGENAVDALAWYFQRDMDDRVALPATFYRGDLQLLVGPGVPLPFSGRSKWEGGANVEARLSGLRLFGQYVTQEIAELPRQGFEIEVAWVFDTGGAFLVQETPFLNWVQPVLRYSLIDNDFVSPVAYPAPSVAWDWRKLDVGVRIGLVRDVHLTIEYARNDATLASGEKVHPNETLVTLRVGF